MKAEEVAPIFLIGFMGCGKSTYGKALAQIANMHFFDLDDEIEKASGKKIPEIFADSENAFRTIEQSTLNEIVKNNDNFVLAVGGGAPCFFDNMSVMNNCGITIYLKCTTDELYENILLSNPNRPLLKGRQGNDLRKYIKELLSAREKFYSSAKLILTSENHSPQKLFDKIVEYNKML